jgi:hypothetical protein
MDYKRIYDDLISKRKEKPATGYTENHHIVMRSMGGSDEPENLVRLTGREHWVAHLLLWKIHQNSQTAHACHMMAMRCEERGISQIRNSRMYESVRKNCLSMWSNNGKRRVGDKNGSYGTMWICNIDLEENKKISKEDPIPDGWIGGRNKWKEIKSCLCCGKEFYHPRKKFCSEDCRKRSYVPHKHTEETKNRISKLKIGNASLSGRIWVNDGKSNKCVFPNNIPKNFKRGKC